jgi:hypothetical protein
MRWISISSLNGFAGGSSEVTSSGIVPHRERQCRYRPSLF